jgi:NTP pyrophosphatase (non-canonical NTP hydrolase)
MNVANYQDQAGSTARYPRADVNEYLTTALCGEIGETLNKVKKIIRDDGGILKTGRKIALVYEIGDCFWYIARLCSENGLVMDNLNLPIGGMTAQASAVVSLFVALRESATLAINTFTLPRLDPKALSASLAKIAHELVVYLNALDVSLEDCLQINADHLKLRAAADMISGDGDDR